MYNHKTTPCIQCYGRCVLPAAHTPQHHTCSPRPMSPQPHSPWTRHALQEWHTQTGVGSHSRPSHKMLVIIFHFPSSQPMFITCFSYGIHGVTNNKFRDSKLSLKWSNKADWGTTYRTACQITYCTQDKHILIYHLSFLWCWVECQRKSPPYNMYVYHSHTLNIDQRAYTICIYIINSHTLTKGNWTLRSIVGIYNINTPYRADS